MQDKTHIEEVEKRKKYYVWVRVCANDQYGAWSKAKKVKVR